MIYANAMVENVKNVILCLGADTFVEYPLAEAKELLTNQLKTTKEVVAKHDSDLEFLKDQINITSVNNARVHNYLVQQRKSLVAK
jgi:prefoldin subunit 5